MSRENYCLRLTNLEDKEPIYVLIQSIFAFKKVIPKESAHPSHGVIISNSGDKVLVKETPEEILQAATATGVLRAVGK